MQHRNTLKAQIVEVLNDLKAKGQTELPEIAKTLGYARNPFTKLEDAEYEGSTQLLAGLKLLRRVIELESSARPKTVEEQLQDLKREVQELRTARYPEHRQQSHQMNEKPSSKRTSAAKRILDAAERETDPPPQ